VQKSGKSWHLQLVGRSILVSKVVRFYLFRSIHRHQFNPCLFRSGTTSSGKKRVGRVCPDPTCHSFLLPVEHRICIQSRRQLARGRPLPYSPRPPPLLSRSAAALLPDAAALLPEASRRPAPRCRPPPCSLNAGCRPARPRLAALLARGRRPARPRPPPCSERLLTRSPPCSPEAQGRHSGASPAPPCLR
jgi:hypothetical protein